MQKPISITALTSISPLGKTLDEAWKSYQNKHHCIVEKSFGETTALVAEIPQHAKEAISEIKESDPKYKSLDPSVLYAIYASREAVKLADWNASDNFGINIGSSRGATELFETYYDDFLKNGKAQTLSSPTTTLGNISSWVAHDLQTQGPEISHSITCSTALHSMLNGIAWIHAGMCNKFLVGGSEAPLTPFTIAQMQALKVYSKVKLNNDCHSELVEESFPCRALDLIKKQNTMVLGEGASMACLELGIKENALATIKGYGYATEILKHNISISSDAKCFQKSMQMALGDFNPDDIDAIVMHAPGTIKGDLSEYNAIKKVFCNKTPALTTNKWKVGHSFGASGMLSIEMAVLMLKHQAFIKVPFLENQNDPERLQNVLVNAVGFGGNAVSILLSK
ncbi:beta-ketoacyl synthase [Flavobacteriaceae bacterium XHP0103]|uniref:beta-ketoacyl synthase N-terminal-like domain-containing protein n=1 Tax=Marixanthotalea marina TaxID=2844359 RepID=UPI002989FAC5|nr:beta-ketoacyl synthase N-terminal-like domain-containing protein [Marixanthotalea marina]MBU3820795.1 beta-ketoacyl synthase [Marixanthotalea marina]